MKTEELIRFKRIVLEGMFDFIISRSDGTGKAAARDMKVQALVKFDRAEDKNVVIREMQSLIMKKAERFYSKWGPRFKDRMADIDTLFTFLLNNHADAPEDFLSAFEGEFPGIEESHSSLAHAIKSIRNNIVRRIEIMAHQSEMMALQSEIRDREGRIGHLRQTVESRNEQIRMLERTNNDGKSIVGNYRETFAPLLRSRGEVNHKIEKAVTLILALDKILNTLSRDLHSLIAVMDSTAPTDELEARAADFTTQVASVFSGPASQVYVVAGNPFLPN